VVRRRLAARKRVDGAAVCAAAVHTWCRKTFDVRFEAFIASRYLRGKRKSRFVSLITLISVAGVSVGVMALIVVMSVMTGFDNELRATIIGNRAHLTVMEWDHDEIAEPDEVEARLRALCPEVQGASPFI